MPDRLPLTEVLDLLLDAVCVVDGEGRFVHVSAAFEQILGYRPEEVIGRRMIELVAPEDRERTLEAAARVQAGDRLGHFENHYLHKRGHRVPIMWTARWSERHGLRIAVARDVSEARRAERAQKALLEVSEAVHEAQDLRGLLIRVHAIVDRLLPAASFAVSLREAAGGALRVAYHADSEPGNSVERVDALAREVADSGQAALRRLSDPGVGDGAEVSWLGVPLNGSEGPIGCLSMSRGPELPAYREDDLELIRVVSSQVAAAIERKRLQERMEHLAHHDALTGLPNRSLLLDRLRLAIARAHRYGRLLALLFVDLDEFKQVNDQRGHAAGDAVLREVAGRLLAAVRACDTVARIGGDEFVVLVEDLADAADASRVRELLVARLDADAACRASIGVAVFPQHGADADSLLSRADQAMYVVKRQRRTEDAATSD